MASSCASARRDVRRVGLRAGGRRGAAARRPRRAVPWRICRHADPLLLVQVTEFACAGFAVAGMWNHVLTDGPSLVLLALAHYRPVAGRPSPVLLALAHYRPVAGRPSLVLLALAHYRPVAGRPSLVLLTLAHYRPVAGRLAAEGDGELLRIEGAAGVMFVAASAGYTLADVAAPLLGGLVARYPGGICRHADPLLLVQVTEFACGGFAVAGTWNHVLTDGEGMAQHMGVVGEFARGASPAPSVVPLRADDGSLPCLPHSMVATQKRALSCLFNRDLALLDVTVPAGLIGRARAEFDAAGLGDPCTVFEAIAAVGIMP
ncbi:hypothetical protein ZWY2020_054080 [Hordeum vulgare]|nr:hypothetical protein ZWY2020_054080 [Hordeum vulgare]